MSHRRKYDFYDSPSESEKINDTQEFRDEDLEESTLLKSFNDRSMGLTEATKFFQDIIYLSFSEDDFNDSCCPFSKSQPTYVGYDESNHATLLIRPSKTCLGDAKQYIITDITGIVFGQLFISHFSKSNQKIIIKSPFGIRMGSIIFVYGGYTSNDEFHIMNSCEEKIMTMRPEHVNLHNFEFPVKDANNICVANIIHKGSATTLEMSPKLSPKMKLLLIPLVILLVKIKAKLRKKQNL